MLIGVPRETAPGETRVAATPETVKRYIADKHTVLVERGAGTAAHYPDDAYEQAGATLVDANQALGADIVLKVRSPSAKEQAHLKSGSVLIGMLDPFDTDGLQQLAATGVTAFALEAAPRITRAQSLDVLSSQANLAGYKAVLLAAHYYGRLFPMMMTAAGTLKPAAWGGWGAGGPACRALPPPSAWGPGSEASACGPAPRDRSERMA